MSIKRLILGGVLIMALFSIAGIMSTKFEQRISLKKSSHLILQSDFSDLKVVTDKPDLSLELNGKKSLLSTPSVQVKEEGDKAYISINILNKGWKKYLPGRKMRAKLTLNIPSGMIDTLEITNQNGKTEIGQITDLRLLSINSEVGSIQLSSFQGGKLAIKSNNGSVSLGKVSAQVNIDNKVGGIKSFELLRVQGENYLKVSNGNVHIQLPKELYTTNTAIHAITKNGAITANNSLLTVKKIGPGKELVKEASSAKDKLTISVSVGNINIK